MGTGYPAFRVNAWSTRPHIAHSTFTLHTRDKCDASASAQVRWSVRVDGPMKKITCEYPPPRKELLGRIFWYSVRGVGGHEAQSRISRSDLQLERRRQGSR
eukprot:9483798-Pyramimonas_sp.AAC.1